MNELKISQGDAKTPDELCALLRAHSDLQQLAISLEDGVFPIEPTRQWADENDVMLNPGFRFGRNWTLDGKGIDKSVIKVDLSNTAVGPTPLNAILTTEARFDKERVNLHTPEECWEAQPRGQAVRDLTIDLGFRENVDRWRAQGVMFRLGGIGLGGHQAAIERVRTTNYGAYKYEGFPNYIQGAYGMYDRNLIAQLDPATHIFDAGLSDRECSHIIDCPTDGYVDLVDTVAQVTVNAIMGSVGERTPGEWIHTYRAYCYQTGCKTFASGSNKVQGHTIYQSLRALIEYNKTDGPEIGVYGDYNKSKGITVRYNEFGTEKNPCYYGVQIQLSPTAEGQGNAAEDFSHEDYDIGPNKIFSRAAQVKIDTCGPTTARRYIKRIKVDASLTVEENIGSELIVTGQEMQKRGGCFG